MIGHPSPRLTLLSKLRSGLLAISPLEGRCCCHLSKVSASGAPGTTAGAKQAPPLVILSVSLGPAGSSKDASFRCPHTFPGKPPIALGAYRPLFRSRVKFGRPNGDHWVRSANRPSPIMKVGVHDNRVRVSTIRRYY